MFKSNSFLFTLNISAVTQEVAARDRSTMNDHTYAFISLFSFLFFGVHHTQTKKKIKNVDTLLSVVHTFLTSCNTLTQPFLGEETEGESETAAKEQQRTNKERKEDLGLREQREKGIWMPRKERKRGIGDRGEAARGKGLSHIK